MDPFPLSPTKFRLWGEGGRRALDGDGEEQERRKAELQGQGKVEH